MASGVKDTSPDEDDERVILARFSQPVAGMWIQATLSRDDFARVLSNLLPLRIQIDPGSADSGLVYLGKPKHVSIVAQRGVRVRVRGQIQWPVLGVSVPVTLREVQFVLEPHIVGRGAQQRLAFIPVVEQADVAVVPGFVERWLIPKLNKKLASPDSELAWKFMKTLHIDFPLPAQLDPAHGMGLRANWGAVKVTRDALTLAVSLRLKVKREKVKPLTGDAPPSSRAAAVQPPTSDRPAASAARSSRLPDPHEAAFLATEPALVPVDHSRPSLIDQRAQEAPPQPLLDPVLSPVAPDPVGPFAAAAAEAPPLPPPANVPPPAALAVPPPPALDLPPEPAAADSGPVATEASPRSGTHAA